MMGSTRGNVVLLNLIISAVVLVMFGFWISYWDAARIVIPDWVRIVILTGLSVHLIVRTIQSIKPRGVDGIGKDS